MATALALAGAGLTLPGPPPAGAAPAAAPSRPTPTRRVATPTVEARATLAADRPAGPADGQVVPGFSGLADDGDGTFWALPDDGPGAGTSPADVLLRLDEVRPDLATGQGAGLVAVQRSVALRDPDHRIAVPIVHGATPERLLTGADLDPRSLVRQPDGTFWLGDAREPSLLHVSASGTLLAPPVPFVGGGSGLDALAASQDGRRLYALAGALSTDRDSRRRRVHELDTTKQRWTGRTWAYEADTDDDVVADAHLVGKHQLVVLERDRFAGPQAVIRRLYAVDLDRREDGFARKRLVVDLLRLGAPADHPDRIGSVVPLAHGRYLFATDGSAPAGAATEMVVVGFPKVRTAAPTNRLIAHRGASGYRPEHTLAGYELAIRQCADLIEPDVVPTQDGRLVVRHENNIAETTDVADHPELAGRRTTKTIDGRAQTGWFTEDFTLAELRTLRARERLPDLRPQSAAFDGLYRIPTLDEVLDLAKHSRTCAGKPVGVAPETKHPTYFRSVGLPTDKPLLAALKAHGWTKKKDPVVIQSFETSNLKSLAKRTRLPLIQLVDCSGAPYDLKAAGSPTTYADLVTRKGLRGIKRYADQVALCKDRMIPRDADARLLAPTRVIGDAHRAGLRVTGWTFRRENQFLPLQYRSGTDPRRAGDLVGEVRRFLDAGMDDFFTDDPDLGQAART